MFKNLQIYRLPANYALSATQLAAAIDHQAFQPCSSAESVSQGWISPRNNGELVHTVNRQMLLRMRTQTKILPSAVINKVVAERAAELEQQQGFAPGKKATKELKERVHDELLPKAFVKDADVWTWIDPVNGWLIVDTSTPSKADDVIKLLLKAVDRMPLTSLRVQRSPVGIMTQWLQDDEAPAGFTLDSDATMRASGESKATVTYKRHALEPEDMRRHIAAGKQCVRLAMTWDSKISFVLTEALDVKGVKPLDVLKENEAVTRNDEERFDSDAVLMTGELAKLLADLVEALGGEAHDGEVGTAHAGSAAVAPTSEEAEVVRSNDELYDAAVKVVLANQRASISLVQRHLPIGYNRAARLLEELEQGGVLGPMQRNGDRDILVPKDVA